MLTFFEADVLFAAALAGSPLLRLDRRGAETGDSEEELFVGIVTRIEVV